MSWFKKWIWDACPNIVTWYWFHGSRDFLVQEVGLVHLCGSVCFSYTQVTDATSLTCKPTSACRFVVDDLFTSTSPVSGASATEHTEGPFFVCAHLPVGVLAVSHRPGDELGGIWYHDLRRSPAACYWSHSPIKTTWFSWMKLIEVPEALSSCSIQNTEYRIYYYYYYYLLLLSLLLFIIIINIYIYILYNYIYNYIYIIIIIIIYIHILNM